MFSEQREEDLSADVHRACLRGGGEGGGVKIAAVLSLLSSSVLLSGPVARSDLCAILAPDLCLFARFFISISLLLWGGGGGGDEGAVGWE